MTLQTARLGELASIGRVMTIDFDNRAEGIDVHVVVEGQRDGFVEREPITYSYLRDAAGAGEFTFTLFGNINEDDENLPRIERIDMATKWLVDQSGRGLARVTGGDLEDNEVLVDQCWDAQQTQVYVSADITTQLEPLLLEGSEEECSIGADVVVLPILPSD